MSNPSDNRIYRQRPMYLCLCCDQPCFEPHTCVDPKAAWDLLQGMGFTKEELLTTHLDNIDFTAMGLSDWLRTHVLT